MFEDAKINKRFIGRFMNPGGCMGCLIQVRFHAGILHYGRQLSRRSAWARPSRRISSFLVSVRGLRVSKVSSPMARRSGRPQSRAEGGCGTARSVRDPDRQGQAAGIL
jgi:hypothetical protein